jgi:RNA polymerase sigma-70 factor (ECF subfamily)
MSTLSSADTLLLGALDCEATTERTRAFADPQSDHHLFARTRAGDEAAFAEIIARYRTSLTNYIYRLLNDYDTAIDLTQETFVRLYGARERYHTNYAFSTYIYRIATNLAISEIRRRRRRRLISLSSIFKSDERGDLPAFDPADECPLPDSVIILSERQQAVRRAIASLPTNYRIPLVLRDIEGRTYEEIAQMLEVSEGTVKSRISRSRTFLRQKLQNYL